MVDCTGQPIAVVDDKTVDSCVVGQGCTPESWDIHFKKILLYMGNTCIQQDVVIFLRVFMEMIGAARVKVIDNSGSVLPVGNE